MKKSIKKNQVDVFCAGLATYDIVLSVAHHPLPDDKIFASSCLGCGGGPAANAAVTTARLGGKVAFCGYLGRDAFGNLHLEELAAAGVDTRYLVRGDVPTPLATILVKPDGTRTVICFRQDAPPPGKTGPGP